MELFGIRLAIWSNYTIILTQLGKHWVNLFQQTFSSLLCRNGGKVWALWKILRILPSDKCLFIHSHRIYCL